MVSLSSLRGWSCRDSSPCFLLGGVDLHPLYEYNHPEVARYTRNIVGFLPRSYSIDSMVAVYQSKLELGLCYRAHYFRLIKVSTMTASIPLGST